MQQVLWCKEPMQPTMYFKLTTVINGRSCSAWRGAVLSKEGTKHLKNAILSVFERFY